MMVSVRPSNLFYKVNLVIKVEWSELDFVMNFVMGKFNSEQCTCLLPEYIDALSTGGSMEQRDWSVESIQCSQERRTVP